ncbi:hypothetical protein T492DRAFT_850699 [Pavlovales sp. CCMP2436]|nr:hypothetical protein T492DRAFT_850699 [Pavlovales sp. CCMP2436]
MCEGGDVVLSDWYTGWSWAAGIALGGGKPYRNGRNQESTSESINAYFGLQLLGDALGDDNMRDWGRAALASELWLWLWLSYKLNAVNFVVGGCGSDVLADDERLHSLSRDPTQENFDWDSVAESRAVPNVVRRLALHGNPPLLLLLPPPLPHPPFPHPPFPNSNIKNYHPLSYPAW